MQTDYELCYCAAGRRACLLRETCVILPQGQAMVLSLREQTARPVDLTGREDGVSVFLSCEAHIPQLCAETGACIVQSTQISSAFSALMQKDISKQMRRLKIAELLLLLQDCKPTECISPQCCSREELMTAARAFSYAMRQTQESITLQELAAQTSVSATRLKAAFRQVYGLPVMTCIRSEKLHRAARQLLETDRRIIDIAQDAGYDNSSKFAHAFREIIGMLPGEYRRIHADYTEH